MRLSVVALSLFLWLSVGLYPQVSIALTTGFVENRGQVNEAVRYYLPGSGTAVYFTAQAVVVDLKEQVEPPAGAREAEARPFGRSLESAGSAGKTRRGCAVYVRFAGGNASPRVEARSQLSTRYNYFLGKGPAKWRSEVPVYAEVIYRDVWPGIDLVFREEHGALAYQAVVRTGADPAALAFAYDGADVVRSAGQGVEQVETSVGSLIRLGSGASGELRWVEQARADGGPMGPRPMDDPSALLWGTFLGGGMSDEGHAIAVDASGNAVVTGYTWSTDFPTTAGAYDTLHNGSSDVFVAKLSSSGSALLWSTVLGGDSLELGWTVAFDASGNPVVAGRTLSSNFPTTAGAYDTSYNGYGDAFVAKLSSSGSALLWSTFLGGDGDDIGHLIILDSGENAVLTGYTGSSGFPTTPGAYDRSLNGSADAFVAKLSSTGSSLLWSTFLGGASEEGGSDEGCALALDASANVVVAGRTASSDFPTTPGAYDVSFGGYYSDVFVSKLSSTGIVLLWSTFLGGNGYEEPCGLALDASGNVVVGGLTSSCDFPTTPGAYDTMCNGSYDLFVTKLSSSGSALHWSTFLGGSSSEWGDALVLDSSGVAVVTGYTCSTDFPTTPGAYDRSLNDPADVFVTKLSSAGDALFWSTFLGGGDWDWGHAVAVDASGNVVVTGETQSADFPMTPGAYDTLYNGGHDVFVARVRYCVEGVVLPVFADGSGDYRTIQEAVNAACSGNTIELGDGIFAGAGNRDVSFLGRALTIRSRSRNPDACIIDCGALGRGFVFQSGEGPGSVLEGITIRNGSAVEGGGINCSGSAPTIRNCVIRDNVASLSGGGIACVAGSHPVVQSTVIDHNQVVLGEGASVPSGGGVFCSTSACTLRGCFIAANSSSDDGGGVSCLAGSECWIENTVVWRNEAAIQGGGLHSELSSPHLMNVTFLGNKSILGAGIRLAGGSAELRNVIVDSSSVGKGLYCSSGATPTIRYCCFWANEGGDMTACGAIAAGDTIRADPVFVNPAAGDFHLGACSPCVDRGDPDPAMNDPDGSSNDMGAYGGPRMRWDPAAPPHPLRPVGLAARADSMAVTLSWNSPAAAESVEHFVVWRDTVPDFRPACGTELATTTDTTLADSPVELRRAYWYLVQAVNESGYVGGYSMPRGVETAPRHDGVLDTAATWLANENSVLVFLPGGVVAGGAGLASTGTGTITVTGIPEGASVEKALLYWQGNGGAIFDSVSVGYTITGKDGGKEASRSDVTAWVTGNGDHQITVPGGAAGASLVVVWSHPAADTTLVVINDGLDNGGDSVGGHAWLDRTYVPFCAGEGITAASASFILGGGDPGQDDAYGIYCFGTEQQVIGLNEANGSDGPSWDTDPIDLLLYLPQTPGSMPALSVYEGTDALDWVALVFSVTNPPCVGDRTSVAASAPLPREYALAPSGANPFRPGGCLSLSLPEPGPAALDVFDVTGRKVKTLLRQELPAGVHLVSWDGRNDQGHAPAAGIYFARAEAGSWQRTIKLLLAR